LTAFDTQFETIRVTKHAGVATVALARPEVLNAYNLQMRDDLSQVLFWLDADPDVRACVFVGEGRAFCAGGDLTEFETTPSLTVARQVRWERDVWKQLLRLAQPTIAAIHGHAIGAGLELALCCDLRYASEDAKLVFPETRLGFIPLEGGTQLLPRIASGAQAAEMVLTGTPATARDGVPTGLVNRVFPDGEQARAFAQQTAARIASLPPEAVRQGKRALRVARDTSLSEGLAVAAALQRSLNAGAHP
jgi:enoyl-CoA hydratase/carnithine racemase